MVSASLLIARVLVRRGRIVLSVLLLALLTGSQLVAQEPALSQTVAKLGDSQFAVREQAEKELVAIGLPAKKAVMAGLQSADIEVRQRCRRLDRKSVV